MPTDRRNHGLHVARPNERAHRIVDKHHLNRRRNGAEGMPNGFLARVAPTHNGGQCAEALGLKVVTDIANVIVGGSHNEVTHGRMPFKNKQDLYEQRPPSKRAELFARPSETGPFARCGHQHRHLIRFTCHTCVGHQAEGGK